MKVSKKITFPGKSLRDFTTALIWGVFGRFSGGRIEAGRKGREGREGMQRVVGWKVQSLTFHLSMWSMGLRWGYVPQKNGFLSKPGFWGFFCRKNFEKARFHFFKVISSTWGEWCASFDGTTKLGRFKTVARDPHS